MVNTLMMLFRIEMQINLVKCGNGHSTFSPQTTESRTVTFKRRYFDCGQSSSCRRRFRFKRPGKPGQNSCNADEKIHSSDLRTTFVLLADVTFLQCTDTFSYGLRTSQCCTVTRGHAHNNAFQETQGLHFSKIVRMQHGRVMDIWI